MKCPACASETYVSESRKWEGTVVRHRVCKKCRKDFYTFEMAMDYERGRRWKNLAINAYKERKKS